MPTHLTIGALLLRTIVIYFFILVVMRIMGKREIGKLSVFDLVISIMIAEVSSAALDGLDNPLSHTISVILALVFLQVGVAYVTLKSQRVRDLVEGKPTVLIANGKIDDSEMRRTRYSMSDLMTQLREKNIATVSDVEFAILETSGKLSVFPKSEKRPVTVEDLMLSVPRMGLPLPLIVDGQIDEKNLSKIGKTHFWLMEQVHYYGFKSLKDVFYCSVDNQGTLFFDERNPPSTSPDERDKS